MPKHAVQCLVMHMSVTDLHSLEYFAYVLSHELVDFNLEFEYKSNDMAERC